MSPQCCITVPSPTWQFDDNFYFKTVTRDAVASVAVCVEVGSNLGPLSANYTTYKQIILRRAHHMQVNDETSTSHLTFTIVKL